MESTSPAAVATASASASTLESASASAATLAKGALRRLAQAQQDPTPDNDPRAYAEEAGQAAPAAMAMATPAADAAAGLMALGHAWVRVMLVEKLAHHLDRGGKQWTGARRKDSLKRVLQGSRSDPHACCSACSH